jgi:hypothetical protein
LGGVSWDYVQYVVGLKRLGHDVYYLEDTGQWPFNPIEGGIAKDCRFNVAYLASLMKRFDLENNWAYRFPWHAQWFGISDGKRQELINSADLLINVSGTLERPDEYRTIPVMIYIDSDPVFTQIKLARGQQDFRRMLDAHDVHFTFGECLPEQLANTGHQWLATRQPIVLSEWQSTTAVRDVFTTVMNWTSYKPLEFHGKTYAQKDTEFRRFIALPSLVPDSVLEIAVNAGKTQPTPRALLTNKGWVVVHPDAVCPDPETYRHYIQSSKAEWSVAKNGYVVGECGWFSCRSACYLAAGRPVIVQDTRFSEVLPVGEGILPFRTIDEAVASIEMVNADYTRHSKAAREIAETHFDSRRVLISLIDRAGEGTCASLQTPGV